VPTNQRLGAHDHQSTSPIEESRQQRQADPRDRVDPTRLDAALYVERELSTQEQVLGFNRTTRSKCESTPAKRLGDQLT
jgi:hypothetical protein